MSRIVCDVNEIYALVGDVARPRIFFKAFKSLTLNVTTIVTPLLLLVTDVLVKVYDNGAALEVDCNVIY